MQIGKNIKVEEIAPSNIKTFSKVIIIRDGTGAKIDKSMGNELHNPKWTQEYPCTWQCLESTDFS